MVELQSCAGLVNASALCAIEEEVIGERESTVNAIAEISAELQREREKTAQLMERILALEAQIQEKDKECFITHCQGSCINGTERSMKKFKRQKMGSDHNGTEERNVVNGEIGSQMKHDSEKCKSPGDSNVEGKLVCWMSIDEAQFLHIDKLMKDYDLAADCYDTDDSDEEDEFEDVNSQKNREIKHQNGGDEGLNMPSSTSFFNEVSCLQKQDKKSVDDPVFKEACHTGTRKLPKMAFCPKEVNGILESEALKLQNAQSHTIRKIIVFASLGIRHGCDDMYELDFNHFSILRKGEPYVSPKDPGEHVLYENPGVRRKMFFPNWQNPILCPVRILEEEKSMRPSDPSCPSCLFLCIKYGGRTRNLPQNEYVRQRMGKNKLKSFGPVMCRMAMLVHIRSGSFFFKALGITLLFMAGFPDDLVQRETKYRNLDLLQKYYRTDEDAEGEELFLRHPVICDTGSAGSEKLTGKTLSTKPKGKKQANTTTKPHKLTRSSIHQSAPSSSTSPTQFGLMGYTSIQTQAMSTLLDAQKAQNQVLNSSFATRFSYNAQAPYHMFPPQSANAFVPLVYWSPYASTYGYQAFPSNLNYISMHPQPYYTQPSCSSLVPETVDRNWKNDSGFEVAGSDSDSSSSSTGPKKVLGS